DSPWPPTGQAGASSSSAKAAPPPRPAAPQRGLESWMEKCPDGNIKCKACDRVATDEHLQTPDHIGRLERYLEQERLEREGYRAPPEPFMAYAKFDGTWKMLKCLLCGKWDDGFSHTMTGGSKDHVKRWGNWEWYKDDVTKQKLVLHPELQGG
ncbi:unnamed protein product, partial [Polarella glacialis]